MATSQEIYSLKKSWLADPCWDIEDTEGFEEHREELAAFHQEIREKAEAERVAEIKEKAAKLECSQPLAEYILGLENRLRWLRQDVDKLKEA